MYTSKKNVNIKDAVDSKKTVNREKTGNIKDAVYSKKTVNREKTESS